MSNSDKIKIAMELVALHKSFKQGGKELNVLKDINLAIPEGGMVAISGDSGCGKSTLLHMAGLLDRADTGEIYINGKLIDDSQMRRSHITRQKNIGFVYQHHHLLSDFTAIENVAIPLIMQGIRKLDAMERAEDLLSKLNLAERLNHYPGIMSGGEQQRTAIARALISKPKIILADEPTGNLDPKTANLVFDLFLDHVEQNKSALIMVTHNHELANRFKRQFHLEGNLFRI